MQVAIGCHCLKQITLHHSVVIITITPSTLEHSVICRLDEKWHDGVTVVLSKFQMLSTP